MNIGIGVRGFRSLSEFFIATLLKDAGIEFEYEKPIANLRALPDFTINGNIIWEHFGLDTEEYRTKATWKVEQYTKLGYKVLVSFQDTLEVDTDSNIKWILSQDLKEYTPERVEDKTRIHSKGVQYKYRSLRYTKDAFVFLPLRLILNENGRFETLFWVKSLFLLGLYVKNNTSQATAEELHNKSINEVWSRIKEMDAMDRVLPKYIVGASYTKCKDRVLPKLTKIDGEVCVMISESLLYGTKSTSTLVIKSLIHLHQISEYDQLVYWVNNHDILKLYNHLKREWVNLTK